MENEIYLNRGLTKEEVKALLLAPMSNNERAFYRAVYETYYRAQELLKCDIENYNRVTGELTALHTKRKYNPKTKQHITEPPKHMILSDTTKTLFNKIIGKRKKGPIFVNDKGARLPLITLQKNLDNIARGIGIQKVTHKTPTGKNYHLVSLKALREAGERHTDLAGADFSTTAKAAQHSIKVKEKFYKKTPWNEIQQEIKKHHPAFKGEV